MNDDQNNIFNGNDEIPVPHPAEEAADPLNKDPFADATAQINTGTMDTDTKDGSLFNEIDSIFSDVISPEQNASADGETAAEGGSRPEAPAEVVMEHEKNAAAYTAPESEQSVPEPANPQEEPAPSQNGSNPYAGRYPYGQQGGYPYQTQQNKNPYSQNSGAYPYQQPARPEVNPKNPYAYTENSGGKKKRGGKVIIILLVLILGAVLALLISGVVKNARSYNPEPDTTRSPVDAVENVDEASTAFSPSSTDKTVTADDTMTPTEIYKKILPSSVGILVYANNARTLSSEGSGVVWTEDTEGKYTYIITCAHVISGAGQSIVVQLYNEKEYPAQIVGYDARTDIGVVRIEANGLQALAIGDSSSLQVGDTIYAIGNPGGTEFANTFTNGIVTALDRPVSSSSSGYTMECIQHNAAINPGNSGGALVNEYGQLIGINSMKIVDDEYEGMGFAVPSSVFVDVMNSIIANGYVANRPKIGISYLRASSEQVYAMFVAIKGLPSGSIIIAEISEDSDFYGKLKKGDLVTAINGTDLNSSTDLAAMIEDMNVGDPIVMKVVRIHDDYSFDELTVRGVLVEDKADYSPQEEETTTSSFEDYFGDYFDDPFDDFGFNFP